MTQYAKEVDGALVYPQASEFRGIPNWQTNDTKLRKEHYLPLAGEAEPREGFTASPSAWHKVEKTKTRIEPRPYVVEDYEDVPDPEHEGQTIRTKTGEHPEWRDTEITLDDSYIQVDAWEYTEIPAPIPPDTSERDNAEKAIVGRIVQLASKYNALEDLAGLEITIPNLLELAAAKNVSEADLQAVKSDVSILVLDLMAKEGGTWQSCWDGLKSRFPQWVQEIVGKESASNE